MEKTSMYQILTLTYTDVGSLEILNTELHQASGCTSCCWERASLGVCCQILEMCWMKIGENVPTFLISHSITNSMSTAMCRKEEPWTVSHFKSKLSDSGCFKHCCSLVGSGPCKCLFPSSEADMWYHIPAGSAGNCWPPQAGRQFPLPKADTGTLLHQWGVQWNIRINLWVRISISDSAHSLIFPFFKPNICSISNTWLHTSKYLSNMTSTEKFVYLIL